MSALKLGEGPGIRDVPHVPRAGGAHLLLLRNLWVHKGHSPWTMALYSIFEPVLYLLAIGVGVGRLVGDVAGVDVGYASFVAPGLLATAVMNSALHETMEAAFTKVRYDRFYQSVLVTPVTVTGVVVGEVAWAMLRGLITAVGFLVVITAFGLVPSAWALATLPAALLVGFAFGACGLAVTTYIRGWHDFQYVQLVLLPMFLFATTFYPVTVYPRVVQFVVELLPLYHAIQLLRGLALGRIEPALLVSAAYLVIMGVLGLVVARRRWTRVLLH
ncbi:ABC transporter permease [Sphaerisporangium corydalis]|uniref:Transport permease protein n=1 Tax=Sphaerisporangium corydalis TaxID=1441875 RepID=A0ABV9ELN7_9ACTN|nr:ABC transporter permease [Sphaerisporangium corydalis]